jgi:two-component system cell cycle sensor histidine kinase/response regulator CckA
MMATILVVDDEVAVLFVLSELLRRLGHTVIPVQEALRASEMCRTYPDPIDLLLTDIVMPGINGVALAKQLQAMRPNMKVLYTSGYGDTALEHWGATANLPVLAKPCDAGELSKHVQRALVPGHQGTD